MEARTDEPTKRGVSRKAGTQAGGGQTERWTGQRERQMEGWVNRRGIGRVAGLVGTKTHGHAATGTWTHRYADTQTHEHTDTRTREHADTCKHTQTCKHEADWYMVCIRYGQRAHIVHAPYFDVECHQVEVGIPSPLNKPWKPKHASTC